MTRVNAGKVLRRGTIASEQTERRASEEILYSGSGDYWISAARAVGGG